MFPVWAPLLVMVAVVITGLILTAEGGTVPQSYFILFAIACVICTLLVEARGLFLTVVAQPLYFLIGALAIGWISAKDSTGSGFKTKILTSVYPTIENFLWLLIPFLLSVVLALLRWQKAKNSFSRRQEAETRQRERRRKSDDSNRASFARSRHRDEVAKRNAEREAAAKEREDNRRRSVEELMARSEARRAAREERERLARERASSRRVASPLPPRRSTSEEQGHSHHVRHERSPLPAARHALPHEEPERLPRHYRDDHEDDYFAETRRPRHYRDDDDFPFNAR